MPKSKYTDVVPGLPRLAPESAPYQARVEDVKAELAGLTSIDLALQYAELRAEKDRIKALASEVELQIAARTQLLVSFQDEGAPGWGQYGVGENALRLESGDTIRVHSEPYCSVTDKEAFRLWCLAHGYERQMHLLWQTANGLVKERLLVGEPEPDGVDVYRYDYVKLVKKKREE